MCQGTPAMLRVLMSCHGLLSKELGSRDDAGSLLDPNLMTEKGERTPLYMAVCCGHREMVREMMRFRAIRADQGKPRPPGKQDKRIKYTPLHAAVQKLQLGCVEELLKGNYIGPIMKCQTPKDGQTALMLAARQPEDQGKILRLLLDSGEVCQGPPSPSSNNLT